MTSRWFGLGDNVFSLLPPFFFGTGRTLSDLRDSYLLVPQTKLPCIVTSRRCRFVGRLDIKKSRVILPDPFCTFTFQLNPCCTIKLFDGINDKPIIIVKDKSFKEETRYYSFYQISLVTGSENQTCPDFGWFWNGRDHSKSRPWSGFRRVGTIAIAVLDVYSSPNHLKT